MARPITQLSDRERKLIKRLAGRGVSQEEIAKEIGICRQTLSKLCPEEFKLGKMELYDLTLNGLFNNIKRNDPASIFFVLKTKFGWKERAELSDSDVPEVIMFKRAAAPESE